MITIIAPHARPSFAQNLLTNFHRQRRGRLLVVANGAALDVSEWMASDTITVIRSSAHQADAMNAGLAWLRSRNASSWARFDDDDYYGPGYLESVESSLADHGGLVVSGMPWRFVMLDDGLHQFQGDGEFTGGSLAASSAFVQDFPRADNDDLQWCRKVRAQGARFVERPARGYCYNRTTRSAPRVILGGSALTRFGFGESRFYGQMPIEAVDYQELAPQRELPRASEAEAMAELALL